MAVLTDSERAEVWGRVMRELAGTLNVTKAELRAAVDAVDAWADANQTEFNTAIPQPARTNLTTKQKAGLLMYVVVKRFDISV